MHRPQGLRRILSLGSAMARLAALMPVGVDTALTDKPKEKRVTARKFSRHTHIPRHLAAKGYDIRRKRPRGTFSTLKKTERLLAKLAAEARS